MAIELAEIMRQFGPLYLKRFSGPMLASHKRAISDIQQCRTEAMGGHIYQCDRCGKKVYVYHACRKSNANHVSTLAGSIILAAIMSGRPITKIENEDQAITGKKLKCPHCGSDRLILLEQLPRPRSRSPSPEILTCT